MDLLFVGIGGVFGSLTRYTIDVYVSKKVKDKFPLGTFIINLSGAFLIGLLSGLVINRYINLFVLVGFLGAYTTFSTFMAEGINLIAKNRMVNSYLYVAITTISGILLCLIGFYLGKIVR